MTADMVCRRLAQTFEDDRIIVPGRCCGDLTSIEGRFGVQVGRGRRSARTCPSSSAPRRTGAQSNMRGNASLHAQVGMER